MSRAVSMSSVTEHWMKVCLGETKSTISTGPFGTMLHKADYVESGIPLVNPMNIVGSQIVPSQRMMVSPATKRKLENYILRKGDVVIARRGELGRCAIVTEEEDGWICGTGSFFVRLSKLVDAQFFTAFFRSDACKRVLERNAIGTTMSNLNHGILNNLELFLPPIEEQKRIVSTLDQAFAAIDEARANTEANLLNTESLFASELNAQFNSSGKIGKKTTINKVCRIVNGRAYKQTELLASGKYPVLRVGNFFTNDHWYYSDLELEEDKYCDDGDLLYAWSASFGPRVWAGGKVIYHYHIWKVIPDTSLIDRDFLRWFFEWDVDQIKLAQGTGTTMMHVGKGSMDSRVLHLPSLATQKAIVANIERAESDRDRLSDLYRRKAAALEELKQTLLNEAFSGKL